MEQKEIVKFAWFHCLNKWLTTKAMLEEFPENDILKNQVDFWDSKVICLRDMFLEFECN